MQTGAISFRVADFLKQHPPFQFMEEPDLLGLVARGRVKFHEADECILWQGSAHGSYVSVIQQGTVSLWEDQGGREHLRDILGAGSILGMDRLLGSETCLYSAKSQSDVVVYALPAADFEWLVNKYPQARQFVASQASVISSYQPPDQRQGAHQTFLHEANRQREPLMCGNQETLREAIRRMMLAGVRAIAAVDNEKRLRGVLTIDRVLHSIASGECDLESPVETLMDQQPCTVRPDAVISQSVLAMAEAGDEVVAITEDGMAGSRLHSLLSAQDLVVTFGDQPSVLFHEIAHAANAAELRGLQQHAREFVLSQLSTPSALDWLARLAHLADARILARIIQWNPPPAGEYSWCFYGAAGREESLTSVLPESAVILADASRQPDFVAWYRSVQDVLAGCDYLAPETPVDASFCCAGIAEWKERFRGWVENPVLNEVYEARPLFDLRLVMGAGSGQQSGQALVQQLESTVRELIRGERDFLRLLAHDCLANLPPLTFFRDLVIEESGEQSSVFQLELSALRPLVDVGRVFGLAAGRVLGGSTLERLSLAKRMIPEQALAFLEAAETLRVVLSLQARVGIRQHSAGFELPPALLSHHDRQVLKSGFRSILRLLEFAESYSWPEAG
ncbi:MAG: hypothetical protein A3F68_01095 [Acidobacteria bacterium RIFCSPLOWO2_12_FULL_54_10]|nr:MAG: hypothetical protein A3F68_01095 [Acidobacteria bacterium RIFCSPLOWO2_12_FULL_54_10]